MNEKKVELTKDKEFPDVEIEKPLTEEIKKKLTVALLAIPEKKKSRFRDSISFWERSIVTEDDKKWFKEWNERDLKYEEPKNKDHPKKERTKILKDTQGRSASNLCEDVGNLFKKKEVLFFRPYSRKIVEVSNIKIKSEENKSFTGFLEMTDKRFITMIEKYSDVGYWKETRYGDKFEIDSLSAAKTSIILNSHIFEESLSQIQRIFNSPIPSIYHNELTFPKKGYDSRFNSWRNEDSVEISEPNMPLEKAKEVIVKIYSEFCFGNNQDRTNAIAALTTPFLKGLFKNFNTITPSFFYLGNRPGVGKDYCAAIPSLVMEGTFQEDSPIVDGGKINGEELRKKITAAIKNGRTNMHFSNNKGNLDSGILEKLITDSMWTDRILGKTEEISSPNELNISLSGNVPIRYTDDLERRNVFINLFYTKENINERTFDKSDLHGWILKNRGLILSALYSLVRNWLDKGKPKSSIPLASFNNWSEVCGGIIECAGLGNPCIREKSNESISGDTESDEIKELWNLCYEASPNKPMKKLDIINIIKIQGEMFSYVDFDKRSDQTKFSLKFRSYAEREFDNIKMTIFNKSVRASRQEFIFSKIGNVGIVGIPVSKSTCGSKIIHTTVKNVTKVAKDTKNKDSQSKDNDLLCDSCNSPTKNKIQRIPICDKCAKEGGLGK